MTKPFGTPYKPGQSGNPAGRPKMTRNQRLGKLMDGVLKAKLRQDDGYLAEALAVRLIQLARKGSLKAIEMILERTEGRAVQTMNFNSNESQTVADIDSRINELLGRAASRPDDSGGEDATPGATGDPGKNNRVQ